MPSMLAPMGDLDPQAEYARWLMHKLLTETFGSVNAAVVKLGYPEKQRSKVYRHLNLDPTADRHSRTGEVPASFYLDAWRRLRAYDPDTFKSSNAFWEAVENGTPQD